MSSASGAFRPQAGEKRRTRLNPVGISNSEKDGWRRRDFIAAAILFLGTAAFVLWQNSRVAVLWDLGYLLDSSWRMALGQVPYRDFPFAHVPLTFLVQAGLIRLAGRHYLVPVAYAAMAGGLGTVLAWRILLRVMRAAEGFRGAAWMGALLLALPLVFLGLYSVYPHPIYDNDAVLATLGALWLLLRVGSREKAGDPHPLLPPAAGAATVLPLFFKQNIGLALLAAAGLCMLVLAAIEARQAKSIGALGRSRYGLVLAGMALALVAGLGLIAATAGVGNFLHWTVQFAGQRRFPGLAIVLADYRQPFFVWTLPTLTAGLVLCHTRFIGRGWVRIAAFCLVAAPMATTLMLLFFQDDPSDRADSLLALWPLWLLAACVTAFYELRRGFTLVRLMPFVILAAIHGAFLSQQLWGSTYALWPLLMLLVAQTLAALPPATRPVAIASAATVSATFLICGGLYAISLERLSYIQIPEEPLAHASTPALRGMADRGPYLPNLDELVEFTAREIPQDDALLLLPGEDPFYYATGRTPQFPVTLFDPTTDPYTPTELMTEVRRRNVRWVIVKRVLQIEADPLPAREETMALIGQEFRLYRRLQGYDVYRRDP